MSAESVMYLYGTLTTTIIKILFIYYLFLKSFPFIFLIFFLQVHRQNEVAL